ncbi:UMP-CMP kinase 2, mitochondrial [Oryzias melastigma]|uniref:UMP-CMP kinase 2, mitochondrial n=1 Tax=Oryzias melastigma TaxID=30732 RepID=A0A3B3BRM8_ORYME|nr:UMP-CMP kinase 2, mitochondrial [Oryzias melastigma]
MAKHAKSLLSRWSSRVFLVEVDEKPLYFRLQERHRGERAPRVFGRLREEDRCYSVLVCSGDRIKAAKFYPELRDKLARDLPPGCDLTRMGSFLPRVRDSFIRGYFLKSSAESSAHIERLLRDLGRREPLLVCSYAAAGGGGQRWTQRLWSPSEDETVSDYFVVPSDEPESHPSALSMINNDVFYSFEEARDVFRKCGGIIPEAASVLEMLPGSPEVCRKPNFPVIVIEGLDATGKTTLTESLRDSLGAALLRSPPECLSPWRALFDQEPPLIRRAFYALGNYITAQQIAQEGMKTPVIVDRFWHSTAAYAIATATSGPVSNLPQRGSEVYSWPSDLLQPSFVLLLTLDAEERKRRLKDRGLEKTDEEQQLDRNQLFRLRVEEAYRRISGPPCVTVDASPSADKVLQQTLLLIRSNCHL